MAGLSKIKNPHDRYFKANMQDIRVARSFFEANLPKELTRDMDFDTLKLKPSSFVSPDLKELLSDLVYSISMRGQLAYLYFLSAEHQSTADPLLPFRRLQYNCALWDLHLKQLPKGQPKLLPVIINVVFYHGKVTPYPVSIDIHDCFQNPEFAREWAFKPFILIDVNQIPDNELAKQKWAALFQLMQKHSWERDLLPFLEKLLTGEIQLELHRYGDLFHLMLKYVIETGEISDKEKFFNLLTHALPEGEKEMTTLAQDWMNEGYQKGIHAGVELGKQEGIQLGKQEGMQLGKQEGKEEGEHEAKLVVAENMLKDGFDQDTIKRITGLADLSYLKVTRGS